MKNSRSFLYAAVLVVGDFVALLTAFVTAYILRVSLDSRSLINQIPSDQYFKTWLVLLFAWIIIFALLGLYRRNVYEYRWREISLLTVGTVLGMMTAITYDFISNEPIFPARLVPLYGLVIGLLLLVLERTLLRAGRMYLWRTGFGVTNVLIFGSGESMHKIAHSLTKPSKTGYKVVAVATKEIVKGKSPFEIYTNYQDALENTNKLNVHVLLVTGLDDDSRIANEVLSYAQEHHIAYKYIPSHAGMLSNNIDVELFQGLPVVSVHQTALTGWGRILKRLFDIVSSGLVIIVLSPFYLLFALLIWLEDRGNPILKQERLSRFDTKIYIYKFRSHNRKYSGLLPEEAFAKMGSPELAKLYRKNGDYLKNDPRVTKVGVFLRKTSLDELPQLFNVFKGDISLVGPRALVPRELQNYPYKNLILSVKSGITGLAQISGRRDISFDERRALDLYYVQNWSFWLDIKILFRTVIDVLFGRGAK
ncbi:MAG: sugar transferase [Patescibacteria group bacterium]|jgi:exopolysaccharide biosynthesis polyprenyl glycosylphosphotransferase|nr:sugar transferase [Patescibacteria group bacterium]